ncbi:apolipoprotein N-acyltransferase [Pseudonocardia ammonioxydans]|nr:apolipoprotein N-acyltransferase [Pseudonocardia ammonioxydans]
MALAAGAAFAAAAPPRGWWPLVALGVAMWVLALRGRTLRQRAGIGAATGLVWFSSSLYWLSDFAVAGYLAVTVVETALLVAVACAVPGSTPGRPWHGWWAVPALLMLLDAAQTAFPFSGFPLPALVLSQLDGPFADAAPVGGSLLVTGLAAAAGAGLAATITATGRQRVVVLAATLAGSVAIPPVGAAVAAATTTATGRLDTAIVQGGGPRGLRAVFTDPQDTTDRHLAVARDITASPDLVLFPENVITSRGPVTGGPNDRAVAELARRLAAPVIAGVTETQGSGFRNAALLWDARGQQTGRYEKEHRVPFGEYIPGRALLEKITDLTALVPRDAIVGDGTAALDVAGRRLGVVISYEVLFADRVREAVRAGGELVLVPTNASSYVTDEVPSIEVAAARLRALESARSVVQAAPTGYSAVVDPDGTVRALSPLGDPALLREPVTLRTGLTPYTRLGDGPYIVLAAAAVAVAWLPAARRRGRIVGSPRPAER